MVDAIRETKQLPGRLLTNVRIEHLWVLVALSGVGIIVSLTRTVPNDFWWHLKAGELIAAGSFPTTNLFAWTLPADMPFVYQSWLGEFLFYLLYQVGGLSLVVFARNMLALLAFGLMAVEAQRRSGSWRLAAAAVVLALLMAINTFTTRTQNWSWVPFALVLLLLGSYVRGQLAGRWLAALPLLMLFWVNAHGGFMMGLLVAGAFVVGETLRRWLRQPYALNWDQLRVLYITAAAMFVATFINPLGPGVYAYVYDLLTDAPSQGFVVEWQAPDPRTVAGRFFIIGVLILMAALALARRRPTITDVLLICGLSWMAFHGVRYIVWFGMAAMPIAVQCLGTPRSVFAAGGQSSGTAAGRHWKPRTSPVVNLSLSAVLLLALLMVQPWLKPALPLPEEYRAGFASVPGAPLLFSNTTPVQATEHLRDEPCAGHLFNEMGYGSYLIWELYPQEQVFIDPRVELYPLELWEDYIDITRGRDVAELLNEHDIACVMLDVEQQPQLAQAMPEISGWQRTYADDQSEIWRREGNENE